MAVNVFDTRTVFSDADSATGWTDSGGATLSVFTTNPDPIEPTGCIGMQVSNATDDAKYTAGSSIDLSAGVLVYVWILANGVMDTYQNGGITLTLGDGTNRIGYHIAGSDRAAFRHDVGAVGWQCLVLDTGQLPTEFFTAYAGSEANLNLSAITQIGAGFKTLLKSVGGTENTYVDIIRYGNGGLIITGGTSGSAPGKFSEIATEDASVADGKAYGVIRKVGATSYGVQGQLTWGTGSSGVNTYFEDSSANIAFEDRYIGPQKYKLSITGNTTANTTVKFGNKIGTGSVAIGANGCTFIVPKITLSSSISDPTASLNMSQSDSVDQTVFVYGSIFSGFSAGITMSEAVPSGAAHEWIDNTFESSGQVRVGRPSMLGDVFTGYFEISGSAMVWNDNINIQNSSFTNNTFAIEHQQTGSFTYTGLTFSGNTVDLLNSSGGPVTASIVGGGNIPTVQNTAGSTTLVVANTQVTLTGMVSASEVVVVDSGSNALIATVEDVGNTGEFTFIYSAGDIVDIMVHAIQYEYIMIDDYVIPGSDSTIPIQQTFDRNYSNPA